MKRPTDEETDGLFWKKVLAGDWHIAERETGTSLCGEFNNLEYEYRGNRSQPVIPEDTAHTKTDCEECCNKAGFEVEE